MTLATIETISAINPHPNADAIVLATVLGYTAIVKKEQFQVGEQVVFIRPDTVLPVEPWSAMYRAKGNRVKAIRLRGVFSEGIIEKFTTFDGKILQVALPAGLEISHLIGVTKYDPPLPQDMSAKGGLPFGIPCTDEKRWEEIQPFPIGELVDITLKRDGQSWTAFAALNEETNQWETGITGRTLELNLDKINNYTKQEQTYQVLPKLLEYAQRTGVSLALRGESCGSGIQKMKHNPHASQPLSLAFFSTWLVKEHRYAGRENPFYIFKVAKELGLPTVELLEEGVPLTMDIVNKYSTELTTINGQPFEGVVVKGRNFSFKIINKDYDSKKP